MKVLATSDLHGKLINPDEIEPCDIFIIAGDSAPYHDHSKEFQRSWFELDFAQWLAQIPARYVVGIGGNHDFVLENNPYMAKNLPWIYLHDEQTTSEGIKFYGIPWVPNLKRWAFHATDATLHKKYQQIRNHVDIVISHGPPFMFGDLSSPKFGSVHCGHTAVNKMIERVKPAVTVVGHIHESHGEYTIPYAKSRVINVARIDDNCKVSYPVVDITHALTDRL